ncbi:olfactory receptor 51L1-like [Halichoeres trimaculatus]|uniref:olfactory receptor 51L1-like n=1 Tax=Halichoeres trimaculatus TaxID=147232 RepID=UPI003D9E83DF
MENSTDVFYFNLTMFTDIGQYRYLAFAFCFFLYVFIVYANLVIIIVIYRERTLHEPMFMFVALLSVNSLYGSTGLFPRLLIDLLSVSHLISRAACFTQIYMIYSYACNEMTTLGVMAYDRYVAVCKPLHYHRWMTPKTVLKLALFAWLYPASGIIVLLLLSTRLPLCGNKIHKVFCANWNVVKLSCVNTDVNNAYGFMWTSATVFLPLSFVLFTYANILAVCVKSSDEFKVKVLHSCLPHIVSFVIYAITGFCDIAISRYDIKEINPFVAIILSLEFVVIPPVLNPLIYGLKLPGIRKHIVQMVSLQKRL